MGAIINFFKSIIGLITGLFSGGKKGKDGFYMEAPPATADVAKPAATKAVAPAAVAAPAAPGKKATGKAGKAAAAAVAAVATVTAAPQPMDAVDLIRATLAASSNLAAQPAQAEAMSSFAEMNAVPMSIGGRRRPGVNMTGFLDLAKTMKAPTNRRP